MNKTDSVVELIELIKRRPSMYITRNSISCLKAFIDGWFLRDPDNITDSEVMKNFQDWIENKYNIKSSHSWCDIILFYSQDESAALMKFFDEFQRWYNQTSLG